VFLNELDNMSWIASRTRRVAARRSCCPTERLPPVGGGSYYPSRETRLWL